MKKLRPKIWYKVCIFLKVVFWTFLGNEAEVRKMTHRTLLETLLLTFVSTFQSSSSNPRKQPPPGGLSTVLRDLMWWGWLDTLRGAAHHARLFCIWDLVGNDEIYLPWAVVSVFLAHPVYSILFRGIVGVWFEETHTSEVYSTTFETPCKLTYPREKAQYWHQSLV
jgi:hypothetical protein